MTLPAERGVGASPELRIRAVERRERRRFIPLHGFNRVWDAVEAIYEPNRFQGIGEPSVNDMFEQSQAEGLRFARLDPMTEQERADAVLKILKDGRDQLRRGLGWEGHYLYDERVLSRAASQLYASRIFINSTRQRDVFLLGIGFGDQDRKEARLAEQIGAEVALTRITTEVVLEPEAGNRFKLDFDAIAERLAPLHAELNPGQDALTGGLILDTMTAEYWNGDSQRFKLGARDALEATLELGPLGHRFENSGRDTELWQRDEAVLSGPLFESHTEKGTFFPPSLVLSVFREGATADSPVIDPRMVVEMYGLAGDLSRSFRQE